MSEYLPIQEHGVIGDLHTAALVGTDGTIDWYCCPRFDSPSVFGSILDAEKGGHFSIKPAMEGWTRKQLYFPDTNVLITRFLTPDGVGEIWDFMPVAEQDQRILRAARVAGIPGYDHGGGRHQQIVRIVTSVHGDMRFRLEIEPRFDYGREPHEVHPREHGVLFLSRNLTLALRSRLPLERTEQGATVEFQLAEGERTGFVLESCSEDYEPAAIDQAAFFDSFIETTDYWRKWVGKSNYRGRWREMVHRSALTLKLLTYKPSGAIVAAPTMSLPEQVGGARNWDYRYTWIRDAAFTLYSLLRLGFTDEAESFMTWLTDRFRDSEERNSGPLQIMYGIDGRSELTEFTLDHWEGYEGSAPVRVGNGAATQLQLDIYGELIDSVYLYNKYGRPIYHEAWEDLQRIVEWVCNHWDQADEGIWETRGGRQDYTYSRLMCWVALERALRIAQQRGLPADAVAWASTRDEIYRQIMAKGWSDKRQAFVQHYDNEVLDASLLLMPMVKFISPTDPRWLSTLEAIKSDLVTDSLVYRYDPAAAPDGLAGDEATFSICSFWYVEALARAGYLDQARLAFEKMLTHANHLGLFSEEIGFHGEQLGNFPQAFTHLALISAAVNLDRLLG